MKISFEYLVNTLATANDYKPSLPPFAKEDAFIMDKFGLQTLRDSYNAQDFIPEDISKAVASAYTYVKNNKEYQNYLENSKLGRKIQGAVNHDYTFILKFLEPIAESIDFSDSEWTAQASGYMRKIGSKTLQDNMQEIADTCLERVRRYPLPKQLPEDWR